MTMRVLVSGVGGGGGQGVVEGLRPPARAPVVSALGAEPRARGAGAKVHRGLNDTAFGERDGQIVDPFGYRWGLTQHRRDVSPDEMSRAAVAMFTS